MIGTPVRDALDSALVALTAAGLDTPRLDAEVLLAHALGCDRAALVMHPERPVEGEPARRFRDFVTRRAVRREPVAYITGVKGFRHLDLQVDPRVLIPRPETEHLVDWAVESVPMRARVVDVGTGSGAIALALADERPDLDVLATDASGEALEVARANAQRLGLDVRFKEGDLLAGITADVVISNPPYVEQAAELAPELGHEPPQALFGGLDGLDVVRRLVASLGRATLAAIEVGDGQALAVRQLFAAEWQTEVLRDLAGIERVVVASRADPRPDLGDLT